MQVQPDLFAIVSSYHLVVMFNSCLNRDLDLGGTEAGEPPALPARPLYEVLRGNFADINLI